LGEKSRGVEEGAVARTGKGEVLEIQLTQHTAIASAEKADNV